jgi:purine catabolism regulator
VPVLVHGSVCAWLETAAAGDPGLTGDVLERAAETLALAMLRVSPDRGASSLARQRFLAALVAGDSSYDLSGLARAAGLPVAGVRYVAAVASARTPGRVLATCEAAVRRAATALGAVQPRGPVTAVTAEVDGVLCMVLAGRARTGKMADELRAQFTRALGGAVAPVTVALGPEAETVDALLRSVREAKRLLEVEVELVGGQRVLDASVLGPERALLAAYGRGELVAFAREQLGPLLDTDERSRTQLLATLESVLTASDGKAGAARRLGIQRQTLYQRLQRIEDLLGVNLDNPRVRASLQLALTAHGLGRR